MLGGGAAGFFTAINAAEFAPGLRIAILERGKEFLTKVRVSGGGRCNVTHAQFEPHPLTENYPRGDKELLGPFHRFMTGDTVGWFEDRGVSLKIEEDGRMFPSSNSSQTIIDCFTSEAKRLGVELLLNQPVRDIFKEEDYWQIVTTKETFIAGKIVIATGSNPKIWELLKKSGHTIIEPVPSLFTFNIRDERIDGLEGISLNTGVQVLDSDGKVLLESEGPTLVTHWGLSGPAILKLSAWGARLLEPLKYKFMIRVNWLYDLSREETLHELKELKLSIPKQSPYSKSQFKLPKRLWQRLLLAARLDKDRVWAEIPGKTLQKIATQLCACTFSVDGKSTFKEEFVTAGGVDLKEVDFKRFESKIHRNMYFAGEVLNIDAITGGFNFQNAWTGGFLVAQAINSSEQ